MALALCLTLLPATALAAPAHQTHPICSGQTCSHTGPTHPDNAFENAKWLTSSYGKLSIQKDSTSSSGNQLVEDGNYVTLEDGYYYLSTVENYNDNGYVRSCKTIKIKGNVTICLNGMQIEKVVDNTGSVGPVFEVPAGSTLTLTDHTGNGRIVCDESSNGSGVYVNGGTLNLYSGQITKSYGQKDAQSNKYGGGVYVNNGGTFTMDGGTIKNNTSSGGYGKLSFGGAGVYVEASGKFIMKNDASVTKNEIGYGSTGGAGVYVNNGTFEMHNNASVTGNTANNSKGSSGCGVYVNGGEFKMHNNASVTGNKVKDYSNGTLNGGGVYVNSGTFEMNDSASVSGNTATQNGGGVYMGGGTFTMNDTASVTGNAASGTKADQGNGGGVYVNSGTFEMNYKASVSSNTATNTKKEDTTYGGGVFVSNNGTFTMNGEATSVSNNTAKNGGGVHVNGTFNMNGNASIKSNTGNGVYVNGGTFTVSGTPTVKENTKDGAASNVHLALNTYITIGGTLSAGASIGVTKTVNNGVFAENVSTDCSGKFSSDDKTREVKYKDNQLVLERIAGTHTHSWTYRADKATITATCANTDGKCDNKDGGSVIITVSTDDLTYNGNPKTAEVTTNNWKGSEVSGITYHKFAYDGSNSAMYGAPKEVGKYKASITVEGVTASVVYEITKKPQEPLILKSDKEKLAVGETLTLSVDGGSGTGEVVYNALGSNGGAATIKGDVLTAVKAGKVTVTAVKKGDTDFAEAQSDPLTITITEKSGGTTPSQPGGSSSGGSGSYDNNPIIKTETKNNPDGSTTKTETRKDGTVTATTTAKDGSVSKTETKKDGSSVTENKAADGSTGTVKTGKNGQTEANAKVSAKAVENAKKNGKAVKAPVEVKAARNSGAAPTVKVELPQNSGKTEVEIPVSNANAGTVAVLVRPDGTEEILKDSIPTKDGIRLTVDGSAAVKIVDNAKNFIDTQNHWAKGEIDFVSARELVNGMSATHYAPDATATRAQLWTILARQNDADLTGGSIWYEKAQNWVKSKGVSDGTNPNGTVNRAQMVTMLWRTMGQPAATDKVSFADVPADSYYAQAVAWAVEGGITQGVGGNRFDPNATCTRAQIAAFLARSMK